MPKGLGTNPIKYNACATQMDTFLGSVVGIVDAPVHCVLNANTYVEAKTCSTPTTQFQVMKGVERMYDVLVSTHCAQDWSACSDPITKMLEYRPFIKRRDMHTLATVPLLIILNRLCKNGAAAGIFVCNFSTACDHTACGGLHAAQSEPA